MEERSSLAHVLCSLRIVIIPHEIEYWTASSMLPTQNERSYCFANASFVPVQEDPRHFKQYKIVLG